MSPTDVHRDGTVTADCSKCVHVLNITFSQPLKHDGTASERKTPQVCTAKTGDLNTYCRRDRGSKFQVGRMKTRGIHVYSVFMNGKRWIVQDVLYLTSLWDS